MEKFECFGYDNNNRQRVWSIGATSDIAETRCKETAMDYVKGRPDTGPLSSWKFEIKERNSETA